MHLNRTAVRMTAAMLVFGTLITPASALAGTVKTDNSQLKMRNEASLEGKVVTRLNNGARVEVLEMLDGWYQVSFEDLTGYVSSEFIQLGEEEPEEPAPAAQAAAPAEPVYVRVVSGPLNVRSGPSTDSDKVDKLYTGKVVETQGFQDGWYKIESGYISAEYVVQADPAQATLGQEIADYALQFLGCRYVYGGSSPQGFDCSGFTMYVFSLHGYSLPHSATSQWNNSGTYVERSDLQPGDLVLFCDPSRSNGKACSHVGIYIGNNEFVHASSGSSGKYVRTNSLSEDYYNGYYVGAKRVA